MRSKLCLLAVLASSALCGADLQTLWEIGQSDNRNAEFALAPDGYAKFAEDGFFVVGQSSPDRDWSYVHPGPADGWAGQRPHTFGIVFGLDSAPADGTCHLFIDLLDTHSSGPPRLQLAINGQIFEQQAPAGAGDASIFGRAQQGREFVWDVGFPADLLRSGDNEVTLTTRSGSWALYDSVRLDAPTGTRLAPVKSGTRLVRVDVPHVWLKQGDTPVQPIELTVRHLGPEAEITAGLGGVTIGQARLRPGLQTLSLNAAISPNPTRQLLTLRKGEVELAAVPVDLGPPPLREVWILPHSHVDIGYTHRQDEIVEFQIANLEQGMALAEASASNPPGMRFKWNPEAVWTLDHYLWQATPERSEKFLGAVYRGEVGIDALYGNMLTGLCRPEELIQCLSFGARLAGGTGVPLESASICDVPGYTWGMVSVLRAAGVKYFAVGPNHGDRVGTIHQWDNRPFYWKSPSGRDRLLCWVVDNYHHLGNLEDNVLGHMTKLGEMGFPYDTSFLFWVGRWPNGGVDNAPPDLETVAKVAAWNEKYAAPRLTIGLTAEFFREFERRHGAEVPEFAGDLTPYWEDGAGSTSRETALNRASADRLSQAMALFAMLDPIGFPWRQFDDAWKNVLLYSEHTWGAWCSISKPDDAFTLDQWRIKQAFALDADRQSRELLSAALASVAQAAEPAPAVSGDRDTPESLDVFNTTQWPRTDLATVPAGVQGAGILDERGRPVPHQRLASGEWVFLARDVPPFGAKRYRVSPKTGPTAGEAHAEGHLLRTRTLTVELDLRSGAVKRLALAGLKHDFVDAAAPVGLNDYRYLLGTDAAGAEANGPVSITVQDNGPLVATLRVESDAPGCQRLIREVRVVDGLDRVELINHVDRLSVREKDGVHFGFGFAVPGATLRMETPWAVVRPNVDQLPGSCRNWFTVQRWVDLSNEQQGILWAPVDAPLMEIGAMTANLLGSVAYHEWMTNALDSTTIYSWAQNNHWHTNYKIDQPGLTTFRYVVQPHRGGYSAAAASRFGLETTRPLQVGRARAGSPVPRPLLTVSAPDVLVETVQPSRDGRALIVRLFGASGEDRKVKLDWQGAKPVAVAITDLTEQPLDPVAGRIIVPGYEIVQLRAELPADRPRGN